MKILPSATLAVAALVLAAVPASADGNKGAIGQGSSSLGFGADGDSSESGGGHASSNRHLVKTGDPGAVSDLVNNLSNPQPQ
ncbi:hypothetical protein OG765_01025 [Streptomyces sp. NBC_00555]|uniref:hypothetical protein n=1 Tax=Streptomyces sp. NBC_00555 TaxID=2903662 RepID=UPI0022523144|nr:hypothetical protein [Streptomyces sp. NBC_00555]MCX5009580.1 hypothetical protein [Streptomyces sp. NBC_00555]